MANPPGININNTPKQNKNSYKSIPTTMLEIATINFTLKKKKLIKIHY
jgi:hypothetical protein